MGADRGQVLYRLSSRPDIHRAFLWAQGTTAVHHTISQNIARSAL